MAGYLDISIKLDEDFVECLKGLKKEYGNKLTILNGLSNSQLNNTEFIDNFVDKNTSVADASIDGNANASTKDVRSLITEMRKPMLKLESFNKIFYELKKKYGVEVAKQWLKDEWIGFYYNHDAYSTSFYPYCYSYDLKDVAERGLFFIKDNFNAQAPQHLTTFTDFTIELVSFLANLSSGAVGLANFLIYSFYFWKKDCASGYYVKSPEYYRDQEFQRIVYKINQPYVRVNQASFSNFQIFDHEYFEALFGDKTYPDGSYMIDFEDEFIEYQKAFLRVASKIRESNMMTFPVLTYALLRVDGKFVDEDFARWCCKHNMKWNDSNFYISEDVTSLSNCCRLVSNVEKIGYFNSIGGTALEVGSVKVNTINLARIAYESPTKEDYFKLLKEKVILCCQTLDVIRHIIKRNIEKGLLPNYDCGAIHLKNQYNTIGIIGVYEALQKYGLTYKDEFGNTFYSDEGLQFAKDILKEITDVKEEFGKDKDYMINIEEIPGERAAAVLMQKDQIFFPDEAYELPLYSNQWIPLGVKTTLQEKIRLSAELDKACSGGSIAHINLDAPLTNFDTAWNLLNYIADQGVNYFAFCVRISTCKNNHAFYGKTCPVCGNPVETTWQRIVGFLTPEKSYSKERKAEFALRDWYEIDQKGELF